MSNHVPAPLTNRYYSLGVDGTTSLHRATERFRGVGAAYLDFDVKEVSSRYQMSIVGATNSTLGPVLVALVGGGAGIIGVEQAVHPSYVYKNLGHIGQIEAEVVAYCLNWIFGHPLDGALNEHELGVISAQGEG